MCGCSEVWRSQFWMEDGWEIWKEIIVIYIFIYSSEEHYNSAIDSSRGIT